MDLIIRIAIPLMFAGVFLALLFDDLNLREKLKASVEVLKLAEQSRHETEEVADKCKASAEFHENLNKLLAKQLTSVINKPLLAYIEEVVYQERGTHIMIDVYEMHNFNKINIIGFSDDLKIVLYKYCSPDWTLQPIRHAKLDEVVLVDNVNDIPPNYEKLREDLYPDDGIHFYRKHDMWRKE